MDSFELAKPPQTTTLYGAIDKEHRFRTITCGLPLGQKPVDYQSNSIAAVSAGIDQQQSLGIITLAQQRQMNLAELSGLVALASADQPEGYYAKGKKRLDALTQQQLIAVDMMTTSLLTRSLGYLDEPARAKCLSELYGKAKELGFTDVKEMLRATGARIVARTAEFEKRDVAAIRKEALDDIAQAGTPSLNRTMRESQRRTDEVKAESDARMAQTREELKALERKGQTGSQPTGDQGAEAIKQRIAQQADTARIQLAQSLGVDWDNLAETERQRLAGLDTTQLYVELAKLSPHGQEAADKIQQIEEAYQQKMAKMMEDQAREEEAAKKRREEQRAADKAQLDEMTRQAEEKHARRMREYQEEVAALGGTTDYKKEMAIINEKGRVERILTFETDIRWKNRLIERTKEHPHRQALESAAAYLMDQFYPGQYDVSSVEGAYNRGKITG